MKQTLLRALRWTLVGLLALLSVAAGVYVSATLAPDRLRREVERQVAQATGSVCSIGSLRVEPGFPVEVEARDLGLWDGALTVERASARVSLAAALLGRVRLTRLELAGVALVLGGSADQPLLPWTPRGPEAPPPPAADDWIDLVQEVARGVLRLRLADALQVRDARVAVRPGGASGDAALWIEDVRGELGHSRLRGESRLVMQTRLRAGDEHRGLLEWEGTLSGGEALRVSLTATELDLGWLGDALGGGLRPRGRLSGVADLASPVGAGAALELDLVARDFALVEGQGGEPLFAAPGVEVRARVEAEPGRLALVGTRLLADPLDAAVHAELTRPVAPEAGVHVAVRLADLEVEALRDMLADMPAAWVEQGREALAMLAGGRLTSLEAEGTAPASRWSELLAGRDRAAARELTLRAAIEDVRIQLDRDDAIEQLAGRLEWSGDRVELAGVRGERGGLPLPRLDLVLEGVSHLLASDSPRVPESDRVLLAGLPLLLSLFEPEEESDFESPHIEVAIEHLAHPTLLWPMRDIELAIDGRDDALVGSVRRARWAGVPLRGTLEWTDEPAHLVARLEASARPAREPVAATAAPGAVWAAGSFEVGALRSRVWSQERVTGRFRAEGSVVSAQNLEGALAPRGTVVGAGRIDLRHADALPWRVEFAARELDAETLVEQAGLGERLVSGDVAVKGALAGRYVPDTNPFAEVSGRLDIDARDGLVRHDVPAVLALTLASESLDFSPDRDNVRYTRCATTLELADGVMRTDSLELDGPDVRLFGSGSLDLGHSPHAMDAEVVVFLFRPVDRVLGGIPILGNLVMGGADNLFAAYFRLDGPWDAPTARAQPLRSFNAGPMRIVTGLPGVVRRGFEVLGSLGGTGNGDATGELEVPDSAAPPGATP